MDNKEIKAIIKEIYNKGYQQCLSDMNILTIRKVLKWMTEHFIHEQQELESSFSPELTEAINLLEELKKQGKLE